jgi:site-specific DNA-cytosine methylase
MIRQTDSINNAESSSDIIEKKTFAEFFAGIGLMRMGLEREGWTIAFANDIAADKYEMYSDNFPDAKTHFVLDDIHQLSVDAIPTVALATASFPCNDLSLAGMCKGLAGKEFILILGIRANTGRNGRTSSADCAS